jgi:hypothetical protein
MQSQIAFLFKSTSKLTWTLQVSVPLKPRILLGYDNGQKQGDVMDSGLLIRQGLHAPCIAVGCEMGLRAAKEHPVKILALSRSLRKIKGFQP